MKATHGNGVSVNAGPAVKHGIKGTIGLRTTESVPGAAGKALTAAPTIAHARGVEVRGRMLKDRLMMARRVRVIFLRASMALITRLKITMTG